MFRVRIGNLELWLPANPTMSSRVIMFMLPCWVREMWEEWYLPFVKQKSSNSCMDVSLDKWEKGNRHKARKEAASGKVSLSRMLAGIRVCWGSILRSIVAHSVN